MKFLIILAVLGVCYSHPFLQDTPEVAAEKQKFFQLFSAAAAASAPAPAENSIASAPQQAKNAPAQIVQTTVGWTGPLAATIPAGVNGNFDPVSNTADVNAATRAFQLAYNEALRATAPHRFSQASFPVQQPAPAPIAVWRGPVAATIPAGLPGAGTNVRNTAEVEAAIAEFTRAYNAAVASNIVVQPVQAAPSPVVKAAPAPVVKAAPAPVVPQKWVGPFAATVPAGLPGSSQVADTAEVSAAKAAFTKAFQQQLVLSG